MTINELYEWAKEHGVEEYEITTIHDTGMGTCVVCEVYINYQNKEVEIY